MSTELHTLSGAYAVNALSSEEVTEFRTHLDFCPACQEEVRELQEVAALLGASESISPPTHLKAKVMLAADRVPQLPPKVRDIGSGTKRRWTPRILGAAAALAMIVAAGIGYSQLHQQPDDATTVAQVFDAPDAQESTLGTSNGGTISVATSASLEKMAVDTDELPALDAGQVYQFWTISAGKAGSAGLLEDPDQGKAMTLPAGGVVVAITIEPSGGSKQPTRTPIVTMVPRKV
jgi:anti-sigma-K factor RskA